MCITLRLFMFCSEQNMALKINAVLHGFVEENEASRSNEDNCSSVEFSVEVRVLCYATCAHGEREDVVANLDGGAGVDEPIVSQLLNEQLLQ